MAESDTINPGFRPLTLSLVSYEPLHHKYRPQTFKDLVGQEAIAKTLTNAIVTQRIAPAYLFTGPRGTGKTSSARIMAKSLNCLSSEQPTPKPCGLCEVCREIAGGYALDVTEIDAASNTGVDNIREIIEKTQFAPARCRYKVYIIDEVHMLSTAAFNALLKTLEEPPTRVVFVLATTDPQRVLPTIISRCQRFDFRRIPLEGMVAHLQAIASQENIDITAEAITLVAQVAQGGLRDAESLLDQLSLLTGQITVEAVWDLVGAVPERDLMVLAQAIADDNSETVLDQCRRLMDKGREPLIILQNLAGFYRDLLIARTAPSRSKLVAVTPPTWNQLCELSQQLEVTNILQSQQHLKNSEVQIKNTTQPRLWLEVTLLGLLPSANSQQAGALGGAAASTTPQTTLPNPKRPNTHSSISNQSNREVIQSASPQTSTSGEEQPSTVGVNPSPNGVTAADNLPPTTPVPAAPTSNASGSETPVAVSRKAEQAVPEKNVNVHSAAFDEISQQVIEHLRLPAMKALWHQHCYLLSFEGSVASVGVKSQPLLNLAQSKLSSIEAAFESAFQSKIKVTLLVKTSSKSSNNSSRESASTTTKFVESESKSKVTQLANHAETQDRHKERREDSIGTANSSSNSYSVTPTFEPSEPKAYWQTQKSDVGAKSLGDNSSVKPKLHNPNAELSYAATATLTPAEGLKTDPRLEETVDSFTDYSGEKLAPSQELELETEHVEKALEELKNFFDGEIIELANDGNKGESVVPEQPQFLEGTDVVINQLESKTQVNNKEQDLEHVVATQQQQSIEINAQEQFQTPVESEDYQTEDDEMPF